MSQLPFGAGATFFICGYLILMLVIGYWAKRRRADESLSDFYLAGRNLGPFVLLLTLFATQYSGNTLLGYPGEAYRIGFAWVMSVGFMTSIIVVYLIYAPKLYRFSRNFNFVTPADWIEHRFQSKAVTNVANLLLAFAIANFLLAQLIAMGHFVAGLSGGAIPYWLGVVGLALIIIVYETLGGMRAVAWTDSIQGLMLLVGLVGLLIAVLPTPAHFREVTEWIIQNQPEKVRVPDASTCRTWLSTLLLVGFSGAVYPQGIQRIYAAKNARSLKRSLSIMVFMPLLSTLVVFLIGIIGIQHFSGLKGISADKVMPLLLSEWAGASQIKYLLTVLVTTGILAAIMSTADSVLLSLSSMVAKDFLGKTVLRDAPEDRLTRAGKFVSLGIMTVLVAIAISPRITLWGLTELKMELLSQVAPVIILGLFWNRLNAVGSLWGLITGTAIAVGLTLTGYGKIWGFHAGLIGLTVNVMCCISISFFEKGRERSRPFPTSSN